MEERLVAFIDILGFKEFVADNESTAPQQLSSFVQNLHDLKKSTIFLDSASEITIFSDCIVLSSSLKSNDSWIPFFKRVCLITELLLFNGFLFRGGLAKGLLFHSDQVVFGTALNKAYELETKAVYPRIVVDESFQAFENAAIEWESDEFNDTEHPVTYAHYFRLDIDGRWVFDILRNLRLGTSFFRNDGLSYLKNLIDTGIRHQSDWVKAKYYWFLSQEIEPLLHFTDLVPECDYQTICQNFGVTLRRYRTYLPPKTKN